jgi:hypothetical protein
MNVVAQLPDVNPVLPVRTITGRYLAHAKHTREEWAFIGAELVLGHLRLVEPTEVQAAALAHGVNRSAVHLAHQRVRSGCHLRRDPDGRRQDRGLAVSDIRQQQGAARTRAAPFF